MTGVDASELGIEQARENARLNGLEDRVEFVCADVFDLLPKLEEEGKQYDVVILIHLHLPNPVRRSRMRQRDIVRSICAE